MNAELERARGEFDADMLASIDRLVGGVHEYVKADDKKLAMKNIDFLAYKHDEYDEKMPEDKRKQKSAQRALFMFYISPAIPQVENFNELVKFISGDPVLEINARRGFWGAILRLLRVEITMVDTPACVLEPAFGHIEKHPDIKAFFDEKEQDYACLMFCHSGVQGDTATALYCLDKFTGYKIICMANDKDPVFLALQEKESWEMTKHIDVLNWYGLPEFLVCYELKV